MTGPRLLTRAREATLCTYCPKLCRPACPVSTVEGRETVTPWGKMRAMGEIVRDVVAPDASAFAPAWACTGCMGCKQLCDLDNPVADTLRDGRADGFRAGAAPESVRAFVGRFAAREVRTAERAREFARTSARAALFPGCTALTFQPDEVRAVRDAIANREGACDVVADRCCGLPLLEAGDRAGFEQRAAALSARLRGYARILVMDPGCLHAMREMYPALGATVPASEHVVQAAARRVDTLRALPDAPKGVAYHDACRLGRGLGVYGEPRRVLEKLLGYAPIELPASREKGWCSGAGGLLPVSRPETSKAITRELVAAIRAVGAERVVTACASSRRAFERAGMPAMDLSALVAKGMA